MSCLETRNDGARISDPRTQKYELIVPLSMYFRIAYETELGRNLMDMQINYVLNEELRRNQMISAPVKKHKYSNDCEKY
jgi:hypothetical protein